MKASPYNFVLASNSPRRKELLSELSLPFTIRVKENIDESYEENIPTFDIPTYLSKKKSTAYDVAENEVLITADTLVILENKVLGKPKNEDEAMYMLQQLSGKTHQVITGVCIKTSHIQHTFSEITHVSFKELTLQEIQFYVSKYKPFDKAGAYGIQEWIGYIGVTEIKGSYFNVMGLPVHALYKHLKKLALV